METPRDAKTGQFLAGEKPHNAGLSRYYNPETGQVIYLGKNPGEPWVRGAQGAMPPSHKGSAWFHNLETGERKRFKEDPGKPWKKGRGKTGARTTNGMKWYYNPDKKEGGLFLENPGDPWVRGGIPRGNPGWVESYSRLHCRRWNCDSIYLLKMTTSDGIVFGKWGSSCESTFKGRESEFRKKKISWDLLYWGWFGELTEDIEASIGKKLSHYPAQGIPKFYGYTETFEWTNTTEKLLQEIINGLEENPAPQGNRG